jgi:hypothetical protein
MTLLNVISSISGSDFPEEYAAAVKELTEKDIPERESFCLVDGRKEYRIALLTYTRPGTDETAWAVRYENAESCELEEAGSQAEADERYEDLVRGDAENMTDDHHGLPEIFDGTDVPGVPGFTGIVYEIDLTLDGDIWQTIERAEEYLDSADGRTTGEDGPEWTDPHEAAARAILANHLEELEDVEEVDMEELEVVSDGRNGTRLGAGGRPATEWRVRVYNGTLAHHTPKPWAESHAATR